MFSNRPMISMSTSHSNMSHACFCAELILRQIISFSKLEGSNGQVPKVITKITGQMTFRTDTLYVLIADDFNGFPLFDYRSTCMNQSSSCGVVDKNACNSHHTSATSIILLSVVRSNVYMSKMQTSSVRGITINITHPPITLCGIVASCFLKKTKTNKQTTTTATNKNNKQIKLQRCCCSKAPARLG